MYTRLAIAAVACLPFLAACGTGAGSGEDPGSGTAQPQASSSADTKAQQQRVEAIRADCMKQKGFKYVAHVMQPFKRADQDQKLATGDYAAMKAHRSKYGFDVFAPLIFPDMFGARAVRVDDANADPNWKIMQALPKKQQKAYNIASEACYATGVKQVYGKDTKGMFDHFDQARKTLEKVKARELNGDPQLVELAAAMASCLKSKGHRVDSAEPTGVAEQVREGFRKELERVAKIERPKDGVQVMSLDITPDKARPYLAREVKAALDDLECGKAFYPVFLPKENEISRRVYRDFGLGDMS